MDPEEEREQRHSQGELVKFMVLVGIMLLVVLLVAATRPLIFDWIIPAALGWEPAAPGMEPEPQTEPLPAGFPVTTVTPAGQEALPLPPTLEIVVPAPTVTAMPEPTATLQSYQVQAGDNLTVIARRFGVTVEALMAANAISNPNRIMPGDVLIIPAP
jgi:LysM repeat protein